MNLKLQNILTLLSEGEIQAALQQLQNILTFADCELVHDAIILNSRLNKLRSDCRRQILDYKEETITHNRIVNDTLELVKEVKNNPEYLETYQQLEQEFETSTRHRLSEILDRVTHQKHQTTLSETHKTALFSRISYLKNKELDLQLLWIDDHPEGNQTEIHLLESIGLKVETALNSEEATDKLVKKEYVLILSDLVRQNDHHAGLNFLQNNIYNKDFPPLIFYGQQIDFNRGTPPRAFGIAALPSDLLHLVMDVVERKY